MNAFLGGNKKFLQPAILKYVRFGIKCLCYSKKRLCIEYTSMFNFTIVKRLLPLIYILHAFIKTACLPVSLFLKIANRP